MQKKLSDDSVWPDPKSEAVDDLSWRLRYAHEKVTRTDMLHCANIIDAYRKLVLGTKARRDNVCYELRK